MLRRIATLAPIGIPIGASVVTYEAEGVASESELPAPETRSEASRETTEGNASGVAEMLSIPTLARKSANSG